MEKIIKKLVLVVLVLSAQVASAQIADTLGFTETIAVVGRPYKDSITLRWAPLELKNWLLGNQNGYNIVRYTMVRSGKLLDKPEKVLLTSVPLKPWPEAQWEPFVPKDKYATIAAQALFGERFELDMRQADVISIVNKVKENEQRFAFALFAADMSVQAAKASGLIFTDKNVRKGERYLYRVIVGNSADTLRGSVFIGADDAYELPKPQGLQATFEDRLVSLQWEKNRNNAYTAWILERSADGRTFLAVSDDPLTTVSPEPVDDGLYEYTVDSLPDILNTYYYRVKGLNPFGETGPPSDTVSGKGTVTINDVPYIFSGEVINNQSIKVSWQFSQEYNKHIRGFKIERASSPNGAYSPLTKELIAAEDRSFEDKNPQVVNYYQVSALSPDGQIYKSPLYLAQLIDSIPPEKPVGVKGTIDENGKLELSWQPNKEEDIYGYRIYKANYESEEQYQVTSEPIKDTIFRENINLATLNKSVYYRIMALDRNQNQSQLSDLIKIILPDKVKPQPPVFLPVRRSEAGTILSWQPSSSDDVARYDVYRQTRPKEWQRIKMITATEDSIYTYTDNLAEHGVNNNYTLIAIDKAGLESERAVPVEGGKLDNKLKPKIDWKESVIDKEKNKAILRWTYNVPNVNKFHLYKSNEKGEFTLYKTIPANLREFSDAVVPGKSVTYKMLAIFSDLSKSEFSKEVSISF